MSKPKEWNLEYTDRRRTMSWEVASHESHLTTKVIEKEAYSKLVEALKEIAHHGITFYENGDDGYKVDSDPIEVAQKTLKELGEL